MMKMRTSYLVVGNLAALGLVWLLIRPTAPHAEKLVVPDTVVKPKPVSLDLAPGPAISPAPSAPPESQDDKPVKLGALSATERGEFEALAQETTRHEANYRADLKVFERANKHKKSAVQVEGKRTSFYERLADRLKLPKACWLGAKVSEAPCPEVWGVVQDGTIVKVKRAQK